MSRRLRFWLISVLLVVMLVLLGTTGSYLYSSGILENSGSRYLLMLAIALGTFVSEDLSTITSGLLAASGRLSYFQSVTAAFAGIFVGDLIIFWLGHHFGRPMLNHRWSRWLFTERSVNRAGRLFERHGLWIIIISRFLPGTRTATYFAGGALHAPMLRFLGAFALAAAAWTPLLVGLSYYVGRELLDLYEVYESLTLPALILAGLLLYLIFHYGLPMATWHGRRRLKGKWIRATKWEYWPWWQVYWLVVLYILWQGCIRYRRPTLFTAVNPCMPDGGFLGESKGDILENLAGAGESLPRWTRIDPGTAADRWEAVQGGMTSLGLEFPVVLKPDEGQRGTGVEIIRSEEAAIQYLGKHDGRTILQEFVEGREYGIFYMRHPDEPLGRITSITIKDQIFVTGNGTDSLDTLIHAHPRAIVQLGRFLDRFASRLETVPDEGEIIRLGELGTHARGSLFLDGNHLHTEPLRATVQEIADTWPDFYFGRFDLKAPSDEALMRGEGLRVMELNGVTSEETHIYDPQYGLVQAWTTLCRQWGMAFQIAAVNARNGHPVTPPGKFLRNYLSSRRRQSF